MEIGKRMGALLQLRHALFLVFCLLDGHRGDLVIRNGNHLWGISHGGARHREIIRLHRGIVVKYTGQVVGSVLQLGVPLADGGGTDALEDLVGIALVI